MTTIANCVAVCVIGAGIMAAAGCAKKSDQVQPPSGQIVARVGNQVATSLELDGEMQAANVPFDNRADPVIKKQVMDELVLRKYLVEQAIAAKLDQEPTVLLDMRRSREQVLASAFMARKNARNSVTDEDVDNYISQNAAKFADRIILTVDQVRFSLTPNIRLLIEANKSAVSLDEVDRVLTARQIPHTRSVGQLSQADLPVAVSSAMQANKPDGIFFGQLGSSGIYFVVKGKSAQPLVGAAAKASARQLLIAQHAKDELAAAAASAHREAKYSGDYAALMEPVPPAPAKP